MISRTQSYLLQCLAGFVNNVPMEEPDPDTDWKGLLELARSHSVVGIVCHQCRAFLPEDIRREYLRAYLGHVAFSVRWEEVTAELARRFEAYGISAVFMKGAVFREYYQLPPLRSMGDLDIIIRPEDREKTDHILKEDMGFQCFVNNHAVWTYWKGNLYLEVHDHMFYEELANRVDYRSYFDRIWDHCHRAPVFGTGSENLLVPDEDFHFLYLMAHTAKHVVNNGAGFRAYLDMVLLAKHGELDRAFLEEELRRLELLDFTRTCSALCGRWFGTGLPLDGKPLEEAVYEKLTEKTFRDGVFGLENRQNAGAHTAKEVRRREGSYLGNAVALTLRKAFPSYEHMQLIPWYSWVDGKPWLLPAAWVYRWFYCLKNKRDHSVDLVAEPFAKRGMVEEREALLRDWGL